MEPSAEPQKANGLSNKAVIAIAAVVVAIVTAVAAVVVLNMRPEDSGRIGYSSDAKVMLSQDSLQAAMDQAMENAQNSYVGLRYQNDAYSNDGVNFSCFIVNSESNIYDMFLTIYADAELTDEIFLSELIPPGSGFEQISLERALEPGDHTVYVALTQVKDDEETGEQVICNQVMHTMDFHVT